MIDKIDEIEKQIKSEASEVQDESGLKKLKNNFKEVMKELYSGMQSLDAEAKKQLGMQINKLRTFIDEKVEDVRAKLSQKNINENEVDLSIPSASFIRGKIHPLIRVMEKFEEVYKGMGFSIVYGPEIENDKHNYEMLNMPYYHPARDMQDTFYLEYPNVLLRSHTSCVQVRYMLENKPPFLIISPGVVYRVDEIDPQHTPCFYQIEGLAVGEGINLANLKWAVIESLQQIFGEQYAVRFSPCYYPYTEPSAAIDMQCIMCGGSGCRTCKGSGWIRVGGAGMVHPNVFESVGYPRTMTGFAFGWGLNRLPMLYYKIAEMRKLFENEIALWEQL